MWTQRNQQFKDIDFKEELINQCGRHGKTGKQEESGASLQQLLQFMKLRSTSIADPDWGKAS